MAYGMKRSDEWVNHPKDEGVFLKWLFASEDNGGLFNNAEAKIEPGYGISLHIHENAIECYYVVKGKGEFFMDGKWNAIQEGDCCMTAKGAEHAFRNNSNEAVFLFTTFCPAIR